MPQIIIDISGWLPAIIFPGATFLQLLKIIQAKSASGVSGMSWLLFGFANVGAYVYTQKYSELPSIIGFLATAVLDFAIVVMAIRINRSNARSD